ncbi:hypothetical protein U1Q18_049062 [Sarracenia purpurea var. burkii]
MGQPISLLSNRTNRKYLRYRLVPSVAANREREKEKEEVLGRAEMVVPKSDLKELGEEDEEKGDGKRRKDYFSELFMEAKRADPARGIGFERVVGAILNGGFTADVFLESFHNRHFWLLPSINPNPEEGKKDPQKNPEINEENPTELGSSKAGTRTTEVRVLVRTHTSSPIRHQLQSPNPTKMGSPAAAKAAAKVWILVRRQRYESGGSEGLEWRYGEGAAATLVWSSRRG